MANSLMRQKVMGFMPLFVELSLKARKNIAMSMLYGMDRLAEVVEQKDI